MDESLAIAFESVRNVQEACSETILLQAGRDDCDRTVLCACADVEAACISVLGIHNATLPAAVTSTRASSALNPLSLLSAAKQLPDMFKLGSGGETPVAKAMSIKDDPARTVQLSLKKHGLLNYRPLRITSAHIQPVTDILVLHGEEQPPAGFTKLHTSITGSYPADLNASGGSKQTWLAIARIENAPPITGLCLVALELGEFIPPGFNPVRRAATGKPANLRLGSTNQELVLCYSRTPGAPVLDVGLTFPSGAVLLIPKLPGGPKPLYPVACLGPRDTSSGGTLSTLEESKGGGDKGGKAGLLGFGQQIQAELKYMVSMLGPSKEDLPVGYSSLNRTVLGSSGSLSGGTARGAALLVYAKDALHMDALGDATSLLPLARHMLPIVQKEAASAGRYAELLAEESPNTPAVPGAGAGAAGGGGGGGGGGPSSSTGASAPTSDGGQKDSGLPGDAGQLDEHRLLSSVGGRLDPLGQEAVMRAADIVARGCGSGAVIPLALAVARAVQAGAVARAVSAASPAGGDDPSAKGKGSGMLEPSSPVPSTAAREAPGTFLGKMSGAMSRLFRASSVRDMSLHGAGGGSGEGDEAGSATPKPGGGMDVTDRPPMPSMGLGREPSGMAGGQGGLFSPRQAMLSTRNLNAGLSASGAGGGGAGSGSSSTGGSTILSIAREPSVSAPGAFLHPRPPGAAGDGEETSLHEGPMPQVPTRLALGLGGETLAEGRELVEGEEDDLVAAMDPPGGLGSAGGGTDRGGRRVSISESASSRAVRQASDGSLSTTGTGSGPSPSLGQGQQGRGGSGSDLPSMLASRPGGRSRAGTAAGGSSRDRSGTGSVEGGDVLGLEPLPATAHRPRIQTETGSSALGLDGLTSGAGGGSAGGGGGGGQGERGAAETGRAASAPVALHQHHRVHHEEEDAQEGLSLAGLAIGDGSGATAAARMARMREEANASLRAGGMGGGGTPGSMGSMGGSMGRSSALPSSSPMGQGGAFPPPRASASSSTSSLSGVGSGEPGHESEGAPRGLTVHASGGSGGEYEAGGGSLGGAGVSTAASRLFLYRHMQWMASPAAVRMAVEGAVRLSSLGSVPPGLASPAAVLGLLSPSGTADADGLGLAGFLTSSVASLTMLPLLRALASGVPEVQAAALEGLTRVAEAGWFFTPPTGAYGGSGGGGQGQDSEEEATLRAACAMHLLDTAIACAVDSVHSNGSLDILAGPLLLFLRTAFSALAAGPAHEHPLRVMGWKQQPWGMHPATLQRCVAAALAAHAFFQQKRIYAERGASFCARNGQSKDEEAFLARAAQAKAEAGQGLTLLREMVAGIAASLERDCGALEGEPLARECGRSAGQAAFPTERTLGRTRFADYSTIQRAYAAHAQATASMCAELHAASSSLVLRRPFPLPSAPAPSAAGSKGGSTPWQGVDAALSSSAAYAIASACNPVDAFSPVNRSPALDAVLLLAVLCKYSSEPASPSDASSSPGVTPLGLTSTWAAQAGGAGVGWRRLTTVLQKDAALLLLQDFFSGTGPVFAMTSLASASVSRLLIPSLLSHVYTPRMLLDQLSVCPGAAATAQAYKGGASDASARRGAGTMQGELIAGGGGGPTGYDKEGLPLPISVYRACLAVIGAMWASKGADEDVSGRPFSAPDKTTHAVLDTLGEPVCLSVRDACVKDVVLLAKALLLPALSCRAAPPGLRLDALEALSSMIAAPQLLMELYINADAHPSAACPYPHTRFLRPVVAALVAMAVARRPAAGTGLLLAPAVLSLVKGSLGLAGLPGLGGVEGVGGGLGGLTLGSPILQQLLMAEGEPLPPDSLPATATSFEKTLAWDAWGREDARKTAGSLLAGLFRGLMDSAATVYVHAKQEEEDSRAAWAPTSPAHPALNPTSRTHSSYSVVAGKGGSLSLAPPTPAPTARGGGSRGASAQPAGAVLPAGTPKRMTSAYDLPSTAVIASVRALHDAQSKAESAYYAGLAVCADKGTRKGVLALMDKGYVHRSGSGAAHFLRVVGNEVGPDAEIGDFLGEEGRSGEEQAMMRAMRATFLGAMSFAGMPFDLALRAMLTRGGFRLPGEAQKIDRLTSAFAQAYYADNRPSGALQQASTAGPAGGDGQAEAAGAESSSGKKANKPPKPRSIATSDGRLFPGAPDVVEILAFSCIMLNTDAHNPSIKKERKMTARQFVGNNRGIDGDGTDLPQPFLEHTYWSIVGNEIKMNAGPVGSSGNAGAGGAAGPASGTGGAQAAAGGTGADGSKVEPAHSIEAVSRASGAPLSLLPASLPTCVSAHAQGLSVLEPEVEAGSDASLLLKQMATAANKWLAYAHGVAKADDARGKTASSSYAAAMAGAGASPPSFPTPPSSSGKGTGSAVDSPGGFSPAHSVSSQGSASAGDVLLPAVAAAGSTAGGLGGEGRVAPVWYPVPYKRTFSVTTVTCALLDLWPHALAFAHYVLRLHAGATGGPLRLEAGGLRPDVIPPARVKDCPVHELDLRLAALDTLKAAVSAALFLGQGSAVDVIATGCAALLAVEAAVRGPDAARASRTAADGWAKVCMGLADDMARAQAVDAGDCAEAIGLLHMAVHEMREGTVSLSEAATLAHTAARFKGDTLLKLLGGVDGGEASDRRLVHEGDLIKVAAGGRGKHSTYRFWLFTDLLVYGSKGGLGGLFSDKYAARQTIPLATVRLVPDPPELLHGQGIAPGLGWKLETEVKPLFLVASSEADAVAWKRHLREALADLALAKERGDTVKGQQAAAQLLRRASTSRRDSSVTSSASASASLPPPLPSPPPPQAAPALPLKQSSSVGVMSSGALSELATPIETPLPVTLAAPGPDAAVLRVPPAALSSAASVQPAAQVSVAPVSVPAAATVVVATKRATRAAAAASAAPPPLPTSSKAGSAAGKQGPYESLSDLKQAFLRAVAFCRPLLSADGTAGSGAGSEHEAPASPTDPSATPGTPAPGAGIRGSRPEGGSRSPSAALALSDGNKLRFYGLFKQATAGDCPVPSHDSDVSMMLPPGASSSTAHGPVPGGAASATNHMDAAALHVARAKRDAWRECEGMRRRDAMRVFCELLDTQVPGWDKQ